MQFSEDSCAQLEDELLFCESCRLYFRDSCPHHGAPTFVSDSPVPADRTSSRAVLSLPEGLVVQERGQGAGGGASSVGVWTSMTSLPLGWIFGPYEGEILLDKQDCTVYSWAIKENGSYFYIDASDESKSNWMRYVSCASNEEEHNLTVFQLRGRIYYRVSQPIEVGSELLVWIGEEYARILGLNLGQHFKYEFGEKELLMKLFQDLQVKPLPPPPPPLPPLAAAAPKTLPPPSSPPDHTPNQYSKLVSTIIQAQKASYQTGNATEVKATGGNAGYPFLEGTQNLVSLGRAQSRYWTFFGFRGDSYGRIMDKTKIICKLCAVLLSYSGNTTNLRQHLIYKHRAEYNQLVGAQSALPPPPKKPSDPPLPPQASVPNGTPPKPANRATRAVAEFLVRDLLPPETVQGEGFLLMMSALDPAHQTPRPRVLLRETHCRARLGLVRDLEAGSSGGCALSLDFWEHREGGSYLTLLAHFVDDSFRFHNLVLCSRPAGRGAGLRERAGEWGVGCPSFVVHGAGVRGGGGAPLSVLPAGWCGVPCAGQVFRGCVEGVLSRDDVSRAVRRARVMAQRLLSSPVEAARFRGREPFLRGKLRSLSLEGAQWHSIQALAQCLSEHRLLLSSLREVGGAGEQQQQEEEEEGEGLDSQDWDLLRDLGDVLKPLAVASATLAADRFSSLSLVKPLLTSLVYKHLAPADSDSQFTSEVKSSLREGLAGSYSDPQVNQTLNLACALDPRFRGLDFLSQADRVETFHLLKREASQLAEGPDGAALSCPKERDGGGEIRDRTSEADAPPAPKKAKASSSGIEFLLGDLCSVRSSSAGSARQQAEQEIGSFQTSEASSLCQEPLNWWKVHRSQYPLLARAARKFLAVPATAVPADWVFTDKGGGVYRKRAGLSPEDVDLMVFLHGNNCVEFHGDNNNNNNTVNNVNSTKK